MMQVQIDGNPFNADFAGMNEVYATFFSDPPPARATVAAAGLPRDARVEIEAVALASE